MVIFNSYVELPEGSVYHPVMALFNVGDSRKFHRTAGATSFRFLVDQGMGEPLNNYAAWLDFFDGFFWEIHQAK